jgi:hypothetical protein
VTTEPSPLPEAFACSISAGPNNKPRSDGLIGVASTRTTTSSSFGSGTGTFASETSSVPSLVIFERSCSPVSVMTFPLFVA